MFAERYVSTKIHIIVYPISFNDLLNFLSLWLCSHGCTSWYSFVKNLQHLLPDQFLATLCRHLVRIDLIAELTELLVPTIFLNLCYILDSYDDFVIQVLFAILSNKLSIRCFSLWLVKSQTKDRSTERQPTIELCLSSFWTWELIVCGCKPWRALWFVVSEATVPCPLHWRRILSFLH